MDRFMRAAHGVRHPLRRLKAWGIGIAVALFAAAMSSPPVAAQSAGNGTTSVHVYDIRQVPSGTTPGAVDVEFSGSSTQTGSDGRAMRPTQHHKGRFAMPWASIGNLAKGTMKRGLWAYGVYATAKTVIDAAGWAINELEGQVQVPGKEPEPLGQVAYCFQLGGAQRCADAPGQMLAAATQYRPDHMGLPCAVRGKSPFSDGRIYGCTRLSDGAMVSFVTEGPVTRPSSGWPASTVNSGVRTDPVPITDEQLGQLLASDRRALEAILKHPVTGAPHMTPELAQAMNALASELAARDGSTAGNTASPDPALVGNDNPQQNLELPDYCVWAKVECDHIEWTEKNDPEEPMELPEHELQIDPNSWSSGLGGGACPAPRTFTVTMFNTAHTAEFSLQPVCDFALMIKPIFITVCGIASAVILAGLRRNTA